MKKIDALKLCKKLNPPIYPPAPMPYAVKQVSKGNFVVINLLTKKECVK